MQGATWLARSGTVCTLTAVAFAGLAGSGCVVRVDPDDDGPAAWAVTDTGTPTDAPDRSLDDAADTTDALDDPGGRLDAASPDASLPADTSVPHDDADVPGRAALEIGTGVSEDPSDQWGGYRPIPEDRRLRVTEGIQGGYHLWGGFSAVGVPASGIRSEWTLRTTERWIGEAAFITGGVRVGERTEVAGITVFIAQDVSVEALDGQSVEVCARVQTEDRAWLQRCEDVIATCCDYL